MAFASLKVISPRNRIVFLNGDYANPAGNSLTDTFLVPSGGNIAETLSRDRKVDFRKEFEVGEQQTGVTIVLDRVVPPEQI